MSERSRSVCVKCTRWDGDGATQFRIVEASPVLVPSIERAMFVRSEAGFWAKEFPRDTPHLDRAWGNFRRLALPWLRQSAGLDPVPWERALETVRARLDAAGVDWWLTGRAALAVRGVRVQPEDLDLVVAGDEASHGGTLLADGIVEPVTRVDWFCRWWGRAFLSARVEWVGGVGPQADEPQPSDFGPIAERTREEVHWRARAIRVPPLELQRAVCVRRGLADRVEMIDALRRARLRPPHTPPIRA